MKEGTWGNGESKAILGAEEIENESPLSAPLSDVRIPS